MAQCKYIDIDAEYLFSRRHFKCISRTQWDSHIHKVVRSYLTRTRPNPVGVRSVQDNIFERDMIMKYLYYKQAVRLFALIAIILGVVNCSSDNADTGSLTLGLTDAPVDEADKIVIEFAGIELEKATGEKHTIDYASHQNIDVLALQDGRQHQLLDHVALGAGCYEAVHLKINADPTTTHNSHYIYDLTGEHYPLHLDNADEGKLRVAHHFCMDSGETRDFTVHFNLRESVLCDHVLKVCSMKPVLSLVDNAFAGSISGEVAPGLIDVNNPACSGGNVVYVYKGHDVVPDDVHHDIHDHHDHTDAATSVHVKHDPVSGKYLYKAAYLHEGDYTVAFTCHAIDDHPETHETIDFTGSANVSFTAGHEARHDF